MYGAFGEKSEKLDKLCGLVIVKESSIFVLKQAVRFKKLTLKNYSMFAKTTVK